MKHYYIPFIPKAEIEYLHLFELMEQADYTPSTKAYDTISYISICFLSPGAPVYMIATADEPSQDIDISIKSRPCPTFLSITELPAVYECNPNASILNSLYKAYIVKHRNSFE